MTIGSESMHIDSTQVIVDKTKDPFKDFGKAKVRGKMKESVLKD